MASEEHLLAFLERLATCVPGMGVILPTGDADVLFLSRNRARLGEWFHFVLPSEATLECLANKRSQYEYAARAGIPVPKTYCPEQPQDIHHIADAVSYPCVVKPAYSHLWRRYWLRGVTPAWLKAVEVATSQDLLATFAAMSKGGVPLLVQERVAGGEDLLYALYTYLDRSSEPLAAFVRRKRRQWPPRYGNGSYAVSCRQDDVAALGLSLLQGIGYQGLANVEFKWDATDGAFKLIEVNVRSASQIALPLAAGVDLPYLAYQDALGERPPAVRTYAIGRTWIDGIADFAANATAPRAERVGWLTWAWDALRANSHAHFAVDDPMPFVTHASSTAAWALSRLPRRLSRARATQLRHSIDRLTLSRHDSRRQR
jgi:predicted ATP-grasp superfamily ATP-dependent carboligase